MYFIYGIRYLMVLVYVMSAIKMMYNVYYRDV